MELNSANEWTPMEIALAKMRALQKMGDTERAHAEADEILLRVLRDLGCGLLVEEWEKVDKWYA